MILTQFDFKVDFMRQIVVISRAMFVPEISNFF